MGPLKNSKETVRLEKRGQESRIDERGNGARSPRALIAFGLTLSSEGDEKTVEVLRSGETHSLLMS